MSILSIKNGVFSVTCELCGGKHSGRTLTQAFEAKDKCHQEWRKNNVGKQYVAPTRPEINPGKRDENYIVVGGASH